MDRAGSAQCPEAVADILREMRDLGKLDEKSRDMIPRSLQGLGLRTYADRIEAAAVRLVREERATGNDAAMREALEWLQWFGYVVDGEFRFPDTNMVKQRIDAALSAPARNCDVLSEEAANEAWDDYRHSHVLPRGGWDFRHIIAWLYAKAKGGDHANA